VWGQKTLQAKASATDRVNARRLLIAIESSVSKSIIYSNFEMNNEFTRLQVTQMVDSFMRRIKASNGVYDYRVVCDTTNNTDDVIDANQMNVDIYLQPQKAAEFIQLQTIITRTGQSFDTLIKSGGNF
jgi:phage tail sheath protein FI